MENPPVGSLLHNCHSGWSCRKHRRASLSLKAAFHHERRHGNQNQITGADRAPCVTESYDRGRECTSTTVSIPDLHPPFSFLSFTHIFLLMWDSSHMSGIRLTWDNSYIMLPFFYSHLLLTFTAFISPNVSQWEQLMRLEGVLRENKGNLFLGQENELMSCTWMHAAVQRTPIWKGSPQFHRHAV